MPLGVFNNGLIVQYGKIWWAGSYRDGYSNTLNYPTTFTDFYSIVGTANDYSDILIFREYTPSGCVWALHDRYDNYYVYPIFMWIAVGY